MWDYQKKKLKDKKSSKWKTKSFTKGKEISSNKLEYNKQLLWFCIVIWATCFCSFFFVFYVNCFWYWVLNLGSHTFEISTLIILLELYHLPFFPLITSVWHKNWAGQMSPWLEKNCSCRGPGLIHSSTTSGGLCRSSSSRRFAGLFWCPWAPALTYMYAHAYILK